MRRKRLVVDDLVQPAERLVVDPHPALFLHHLALGREGVLVDPERRHPIRLEPQRQRQVLRRHRLPEHRLVVVGVGVALAADRRDVRRVRLGLDVLRSLEHHVLEEVREAGAAGLLVLRSDVIPDLQVDDRRRVILGQHDGQPVRQRRDLVLQLGRTRGRRGRGYLAVSSRAAASASPLNSPNEPVGHRCRLSPSSAGLFADEAEPGKRPASSYSVDRIGIDARFRAREKLQRRPRGR